VRIHHHLAVMSNQANMEHDSLSHSPTLPLRPPTSSARHARVVVGAMLYPSEACDQSVQRTAKHVFFLREVRKDGDCSGKLGIRDGWVTAHFIAARWVGLPPYSTPRLDANAVDPRTGPAAADHL